MANTTLNKTYSANPTNGNKSTFSCWVKRGKLGTRQMIFSAYDGSGPGGQDLEFEASTDVLSYNNTEGDNDTSMVFRDTSAWYHIVLAVDTTQGSASTQVKIYVNGVQQSLGVNTGASAVGQFGKNGLTARIGSNHDGTNYYFDGSMSHFYFIDGTAYDATAFGETDATTGEWVGKTSPSVTYGTNGFFILKDGNGITDQSGEGNDFTLGGGTLTDLKDNPENVFATLNPLDVNSDGVHTLSNGNLTAVNTAQGFDQTRSTYYLSTGKWYWEFKCTRVNDSIQVGVVQNNYAGGSGERRNYQSSNGSKYSGSSSSYGATWTVNDIIGIALDLDNGTITFYKNGASQGVAFTDLLTSIDDTGWTPVILSYNGDGSFNFGNGYFGTTAITTNSGNGYSGAEGSSKFNYTVPTGYSALSTKGLNE